MAATPGTVEHRTIHLNVQGALTIVGTIGGLIIARQVFIAAHRPLSWAAAAAVAAILLDPIVDRLAVRIRRVPAVLVAFVLIGAVGVGTSYLVFDGVQHAVDRLETAAPRAASRIEQRDDRLGEVAKDFDLSKRVEGFTDSLGKRVTGGDDVLRSTAGTAPSYLVCAILTIFLMTYGPRIARGALDQDPDPARRERIATVIGPAVARARSAILLTAAWGGVVGVGAGLVARMLDLPAPAAVGFTAGVLAVLPHVGIAFGSVPLLLLSLGFRSATAAIVLAVLVVALQVVDSVVVRRQIARRAVETGLLVPWVVALLGYEVYGIGGGAYGLAFAIGGLAVLDRLRDLNHQRIAKAPAKRAAAKKAAAKRAPAKAAAKATKAAKQS
jgi:predicted PurR-regulated permease PerM